MYIHHEISTSPARFGIRIKILPLKVVLPPSKTAANVKTAMR